MEVAPPGRQPLVALRPAGSAGRRRGCRRQRLPVPHRGRVRRHTCCPRTRAGGRSRRTLRGRGVHDERRAAAQGVVHPVAERRGGDLVPRSSKLAEAGEAARPPRVRRPALRPSRRGRERGRPEPLRLAGRARRPRGRRVPRGPSGCRPGADRRHRPLRRRRDDDRGGSRVARSQGDRVRGGERRSVRDIVANPGTTWQDVLGNGVATLATAVFADTCHRPT